MSEVDKMLGDQKKDDGQPDAEQLKKQLEETQASLKAAEEKAKTEEDGKRYFQSEKDRIAAELEATKKQIADTSVALTEEQLAEKESALKLGLVDKSEVEKLRQEMDEMKKANAEKEIQQAAQSMATQVAKVIEEFPFVDKAKIDAKMKESNVSPSEAALLLYPEEIFTARSKGNKPFVPTVDRSSRIVEPPKTGKVLELDSPEMTEALTNAMFGESE